MHVVTMCGSHHSASANAAALATIEARLVACGATVEAIDVSTDLPAFRPELVDQPPAPVRAVSDVFLRADGVVFAIPEYAGGMAGWVKNVTDWMVGAAALYERPAVVVSAATAGGTNAIGQLARTLTWQGGFVVATFGIAAPLTMLRDATLTDEHAVAGLEAAADTLLAVLRGERSAHAATTEALAAVGLDIADRLS
jgi:chromate reductase, NAD(P)H dehydrogenase (quinone)